MIVVVNEKLDFKFRENNRDRSCERKTRRDILDFKLRENNRDQLSQLRRERRSLASVNCPYLATIFARRIGRRRRKVGGEIKKERERRRRKKERKKGDVYPYETDPSAIA